MSTQCYTVPCIMGRVAEHASGNCARPSLLALLRTTNVARQGPGKGKLQRTTPRSNGESTSVNMVGRRINRTACSLLLNMCYSNCRSLTCR